MPAKRLLVLFAIDEQVSCDLMILGKDRAVLPGGLKNATNRLSSPFLVMIFEDGNFNRLSNSF